MKTTNPERQSPDAEFLKAAQQLRKLLEDQQASELWQERRRLGTLLSEKFASAFGLGPDRLRLSYRFFTRHENSTFNTGDRFFDHKSFFQRNGNLVIVSQPYGFDEAKLTKWVNELGGKLTVAKEWGFYFPGKAPLFFIEFSRMAANKLDKLARSLR